MWAAQGAKNGLRGGGVSPIWVIAALTLAACAVLLLRRRRPVAVFWLTWIYGFTGLFVAAFAPFAVLLVALHNVARRMGSRIAIIALIACVLPFGVNSYNAAATVAARKGEPFLGDFIVAASMWAAVLIAVWGQARWAYLTEERGQAVRDLQAAEAVRAERTHLARELHDTVAHAVTAMILQAAGARTLVAPEQVRLMETLDAIEHTGVEAMGEMHELLDLLRADRGEGSSDGDRRRTASLKNIEGPIQVARTSGVDVELAVDGCPVELDHSVDLAAFRVVQEALTNIVKHAGRGASARIHLQWCEQGLILTVRDWVGLEPQELRSELSSAHGLKGLAARVMLVGGQLETGHVDGGFLVRARFPGRSAVGPRGDRGGGGGQ